MTVRFPSSVQWRGMAEIFPSELLDVNQTETGKWFKLIKEKTRQIKNVFIIIRVKKLKLKLACFKKTHKHWNID